MEKHYQHLANYYAFNLENRLRLSKKLFSARISIVGLMAEVKTFIAKKGDTAKTTERMELYDNIMDALDEADKLETQNYSLIQITNAAIRERDKANEKIKELETKIRDIERFHS